MRVTLHDFTFLISLWFHVTLVNEMGKFSRNTETFLREVPTQYHANVKLGI